MQSLFIHSLVKALDSKSAFEQRSSS